MAEEMGSDAKRSPSELEAIAFKVREVAHQYQGDGLALLQLLRLLEALHREIRDDSFQQALPDNRQALYAMLRDMEAEGGWPYIHRMKLRSLLVSLLQESEEQSEEHIANGAAEQSHLNQTSENGCFGQESRHEPPFNR